MSKLKDFDLAIAAVENTPRGYLTENGNYDSYMSNEAWDAYLSSMDPKHRMQFDDGSGGELKEKNGRPPKMASFASSSRMAYKCSKCILTSSGLIICNLSFRNIFTECTMRKA